MTFQRKLSGVEHLWLVAGELDPPFANQLVLEGQGHLDLAAWEAAVETAAKANPGCQLVLKGALWWTRWRDCGQSPPVVAVDGTSWDAQSEQGADFLSRPLPPKAGPTCEVLLVGGAQPRVVIRSHHAVMDGGGHLHFARDIFRCLRGEPALGATATTTDLDIARMKKVSAPKPRHPDAASPTGPSRGTEAGLLWRRRFVAGRHSQLLPRVALTLAQRIREDDQSETSAVRFDIPVDMRRHLPECSDGTKRSTANMTGMLHVQVPESTTAAQLQQDIRSGLNTDKDAHFAAEMAPARYLPRFLMRAIGKKAAQRSHDTHLWIASGALSNLGRIDLEDFRCDSFRATTCFFIPPGTEGTAFFMSLAGTPNGVELCVTQPRRLGDAGRLESCLDSLEKALTDSEAPSWGSRASNQAAAPEKSYA